MTIRRLQPQDLPAYFRLRTALWPDSASDFELEVAEILQSDHQVGFVAEQEGALVGFVEVSLRAYAEGCESSPVGYLEGWYVAPTHRKTGVGRRLVEAAEDWARAQGCTEMASDSEISNTQSHLAHARLGYQEVERIVCFRKPLQEVET
ncbi:aminoglycoside 6'-N-acetyltransferase [Meiothermus sp.]|uniref:aminoglycoside 6'-N-acetyltransferase n=1 Tax=Meiothermus sp. TaxID=1955249 RepID=UPI0021DD65AB|nr:aminoglycoside 6'-N-acetyltransferase [Meiothermus sp.]GIW34097.1 MAG: aminoglycoside N(6')-acetyltransferase type 1 [Meiothermus sp.]